MKKMLSVWLAMCLVVSLLPLGMLTASADTAGYYTYSVSGGKATITNVDASIRGNVTIPSTLGGYPVTTIGNDAFYRCSSLTSVTLPNCVTTIGNRAFDECSGLTSVTIPNSVTSIGNAAFAYCANLTSMVVDAGNPVYHSQGNCVIKTATNTLIVGCRTSVIPAYITTIGDYVFNGCSGLTSVTIPYGVTTIAYAAFAGCSSLVSVVLPNSVTTLESFAFSGCSKLSEIVLPKSVTSIGSYAFYNCNSLTDVWYLGDARNDITIETTNNPYLFNATWHYVDACPGEHCYTGDCDDVCNVCDEFRAVHHVYDDVCDAVCNECGFVRIVHHVYDNVCDATCNECGFVRTVPDHTYDNACDVDCNECGLVRAVPDHDYTVSGGYTCSGCGISVVPTAPVVENKTNRSVTLVKVDGLEYSKDGTTWQDSPLFDNLSFDTTYTFYQRVKASSAAQVSGISDGTTVVFKSAQAQLSAPMVISFTDTVVTLTAVEGAEYSNDGIHWQASAVFTGLQSGTLYAFYQRLAETDTHEAGDSSAAIYIITDKTEQTAIPDAPTLQSFTAYTVTLVAVDGCEYSKNGKTWQASPTFTDLDPATSYTFYQRYKETATHYTGKSSVGATFRTDKAIPSTPPIPQLASRTHDTVTLVECAGCEYSMDTVVWQSGCVFTDLSPNTTYTFYQRYIETDTHKVSAYARASFTTDKAPQTAVPDAPTLQSFTAYTVTLVAVDGCEYSMDGVNWQSGTIFGGLSYATVYVFYQRYKETETHYAGQASIGATFTTDKAEAAAPPSPEVVFATYDSVTLKWVSGCEYSMDGVEWTSGNIFIYLSPGTYYVFYQRYAETETHKASSAKGIMVKTGRAPQYDVPDAPTLESFTASEITLVAVDGCEYSMDGVNWQESTTFSGLTHVTSYTFYQRYKETETHYVGQASIGATFTTDKAVAPTPSAPTMLSKTHDTVVLVAHDGYEYSIGGVEWQTSPVFKGLTPKTNYVFYQRVADSDTYYAGLASGGCVVKTEAHPLFDDTLDTSDVRFVLKSIVGMSAELTEDEVFYADFNEDGKVDSADIRRMLLMITAES